MSYYLEYKKKPLPPQRRIRIRSSSNEYEDKESLPEERRVDGRRGVMAVFSRASVASCPAFRLTRRNLLRRVSASNPREPWAQGGGGGGLSVGTVLRPVDSVGESA